MSRLSRAREGGGYIDFFTNLGLWLPVIGTFGVATGDGLKALTAGNVGLDIAQNGEFTTDYSGWGGGSATISRVDSTSAPAANSSPPALDKWALKILLTGGGGYASRSNTGHIIGASYVSRCLGYAPSANTGVKACTISDNMGGASPKITVEDAWELLTTTTGLATVGTNQNFYLTVAGGSENDIAYFDAVTRYRQSSLALYLGPTTANGSYIWDLPMPASGVVPRGMVVRYTSPLDYWEVRVKPGTAGNDTDIVEVVAGVETVRATADVDYSTSATDQVKITLNGAVITVDVKKSGASAFTTATSYSTMATGLTQNRIGYMSYGLPGTSEVAKFEVVG